MTELAEVPALYELLKIGVALGADEIADGDRYGRLGIVCRDLRERRFGY
jgi:hypothetical protein